MVSQYWLGQAPDLVISGLYTMWCSPVPDTSVGPLLPAKATLPAEGYCVPFWCLGHHTWCRFGSDKVDMGKKSHAVWSCYWASGSLSCCIDPFVCLYVSGCFRLRVRMNNQPLRYGSPIRVEGLLPKDGDTQAHQRTLWTRAICVQIQWLLLTFHTGLWQFSAGGGVLLVDGQHISHFNRCSGERTLPVNPQV